MRNIIIIGMLLAAASTAGWFSVQRDGDHMTIDINRSEIRNDTRRAIDRGRQILDERQQRVDEERAELQQSAESQPQWPLQPGNPWQPNYPPYDSRGYNGTGAQGTAPISYGQPNNYNPAQFYSPAGYGPTQPYTNPADSNQSNYYPPPPVYPQR